MNQLGVREIAAVFIGIVVLLFLTEVFGWYYHAAAIIGFAAFGFSYYIWPKPKKPHAVNEQSEDELTESIRYANEKMRNIRTQFEKLQKANALRSLPDMGIQVEELLKLTLGIVNFVKEKGSADSVSMGLLRTVLDLTETGVTNAASVAGLNSPKAQVQLQAFTQESLPELIGAMHKVNDSLASGELLSFDVAMSSISGTLNREGLTTSQPVPVKRSA